MSRDGEDIRGQRARGIDTARERILPVWKRLVQAASERRETIDGWKNDQPLDVYYLEKSERGSAKRHPGWRRWSDEAMRLSALRRPAGSLDVLLDQRTQLARRRTQRHPLTPSLGQLAQPALSQILRSRQRQGDQHLRQHRGRYLHHHRQEGRQAHPGAFQPPELGILTDVLVQVAGARSHVNLRRSTAARRANKIAAAETAGKGYRADLRPVSGCLLDHL